MCSRDWEYLNLDGNDDLLSLPVTVPSESQLTIKLKFAVETRDFLPLRIFIKTTEQGRTDHVIRISEKIVELIEEFMISANEAVAKELSSNYYPCIFRVHKQPTASKLEILESTLSALDLHLPKNIKPKHFRDILDKAKNKNVIDHLVVF